MKTLTTIALAAALFGGVSMASAQNAPTSQVSPSPDSINKGSRPTAPSGTESESAATGSRAHVAGRGKYCKVTSANGTLDCFYASMDACQKHSKSDNLRCVTNPNRGT
jgi:hypothetical protein